MNCTQTFKSTTKSIFTSIIRFPEILSFLLGDSSSISSTLDEDNEGVWETENVSLLVANVAVAVGITTVIGIQIAIFWFIICSWEINSSIYII